VHVSTLPNTKYWKVIFASSDHRTDDLRLDPWLNLLPDQMSEQKEPLVGGQGEDRLMEGPFVVLALMRPLQSLYNTVINVVHHTSRGQLAISWSQGYMESQGGSEHLHGHQYSRHRPGDGICGPGI